MNKIQQVSLDQIEIDPQYMRGDISVDTIMEIMGRMSREAKLPQQKIRKQTSPQFKKDRFKNKLEGYIWPDIYLLMLKVERARKKRSKKAIEKHSVALIEMAQKIYMMVIGSEDCEQINIDYGGGAVLFDGDTPWAKIEYQQTTRFYSDIPIPFDIDPLIAIERFVHTGELDEKWYGNVEDFDPNETVVVGSRFPNV